MLGLIVLGFLAIYLLVSVFVVRATVHYARRTGRNPRWWGLIACLVMYNLLFWEVIPTMVANEYYCRTAAGFEIYKALEQWKNENPNVAEGLSKEKSGHRQLLDDGTTRYMLNERFALDHRKTNPVPLLSTTVVVETVVDLVKRDVLARAVSVGYGHGSPMLGGGWRIVDWFDLKRCYPMRAEFVRFETSITKLGIPSRERK